MPNIAPPSSFDGAPRQLILPAGTLLTRIHSAQFPVGAFNPTVAREQLRGGRFDSTPEDPYAFLYAAGDDPTAVAEALLRELPIDERGRRLLPRLRLGGLRIGWLRTTADLAITRLRSGRDLAAIGQDAWLTAGPASEYEMTRRWASAIRGWDKKAAGLTWRSRLEPDGTAYVLFSDRGAANALEEQQHGMPLPAGERDISGGAARRYTEAILTEYRTVLA